MTQCDGVDLQAAELLLRAKRQPLISPGTYLTREFFEWCSTSGFGLVEILSLFAKTGSSIPASEKIGYVCDVQCPTCKTWRVQRLPKKRVQDVISLIKGASDHYKRSQFICAPCKAIEQAEYKLKQIQYVEDCRNRKAQRTESYIENYLDPAKIWRDTCPESARFQIIAGVFPDMARVAAAIVVLPYQDFLRTPYWKAVAYEVKRQAGFKCSICSGVDHPAAHHRSYHLHGYEHTDEGLKELICLCQKCHATYHYKLPLPPS